MILRTSLAALAFFVIGVTVASAQDVTGADTKCSTTEPKKQIECLEGKIDVLTKKLDAIKVPDLNNVVIEWAGHNNVCLAILDGDPHPQVRDTCADAAKQRFNIKK